MEFEKAVLLTAQIMGSKNSIYKEEFEGKTMYPVVECFIASDSKDFVERRFKTIKELSVGLNITEEQVDMIYEKMEENLYRVAMYMDLEKMNVAEFISSTSLLRLFGKNYDEVYGS